MDILYVIGNKGCEDNLELRCSLRSIAQYGKNIGRVFVVGLYPEWLSDEVIKIPFKQPFEEPASMAEKSINIMTSVKYAVENSNIDDEFLVSMDDHYYIRNVDFDNYPYYARKLNRSEEIPQEGSAPYRQFLIDSRKYLESKGLPVINFTLHRNLHASRKDLKECESYINEIVENRLACELFLLINNYRHSKTPIKYVIQRDVKVHGKQDCWKIKEHCTEVFSSCDFEKDSDLYNLLTERYNNKCKYEK